MKRFMRFAAILSVLALVAAACNGAADTTTTEGASGLKVCFVTDDAGVDDRSFNASGWAGVNDAVASGAALDDDVFPILLESTGEADYQPHVESCLAQGSEHIVTSGFKLAGTTETFAAENPNVQWTIIDFGTLGPNVTGLEYQTDEGTFVTGYLAAGMTQTGVVATYGGINIPTVAIFMDGFARGVAHYNEVKGTDVVVLGWDIATQEGTFTNTFNPAEPAVRATCESQLDENADIILPVGGAINLPCGTAMQDRNLDAALIGVDSDNYESFPAEYQDLWLVSALKGIQIQTTRSIEAHFAGNPTGGTSAVGNLENGGIGMSGYHSWDARVTADLKAEVEQLLEDIKDGTVTWDKFVVGGG